VWIIDGMSENTKSRYVLVTTEFRGVFAGDLVKQDGNIVTLNNARNCIYWSSDVGGFVGLAANGPSDSCRIGSELPETIELFGVTSIANCTEEAERAWKSA
jgi:hypothetical protein